MDAIVQGFPIFLLIFCRITAFFVVAPIFAFRNLPNTFKIGLGFFISLLVFLTYGFSQTVITDATYVLMIIREILIGLAMGFVVYLFFAVVQAAGGFMDMQIGFAMANVIDPVTGSSAPLLGNFKYMLAMMLFLMMDGHHYLLNALMGSYSWLPLDNEVYAHFADGRISDLLLRLVGNTFLLSLQVAAPIIVAMFLTDVGMAFLAKTAPQFNIFVIGIPLKLLIGLALLMLIMPEIATLFSHLFSIMFDSLEKLFAVMQGKSGT
ncbi:flagellar biosynthetic protein FliR [Paenibacillus protaetiae]|uniref:Flagellar biosynthetic protein FliR n=1 Tax=Paenibacillus protaetiae TaxID=2509456 RepID=A0A4V0YFN5_9BACL|nr:flagellar biosynthetic protein FliR [Paenibacillus protaetiae]QAY68331.1 flagellar type III secretion system protein FliR [Paenibacillus protaetiae]